MASTSETWTRSEGALSFLSCDEPPPNPVLAGASHISGLVVSPSALVRSRIMWERVTAAIGASAIAGFIAGAAVMGSYAAQHQPPPCPESSIAPPLPFLGSVSKGVDDAASPWACRVGPVPCAFARDVAKVVSGDVPVVRELGMAGEYLAHT